MTRGDRPDPTPQSLEDAWVDLLSRLDVPVDTPLEAMRLVFYTGARIAVVLAGGGEVSLAQLGLDLRAFRGEVDDRLARGET